MKRSALLSVAILLSVFLVSVTGYGYQGRMEGMGLPYGLVEDESDFLIHPSGMASGKDLTFYGVYGQTHENKTGEGHESEHEGQMGFAFPVGPGRMGLFYDYFGGNVREYTYGYPFGYPYLESSRLVSYDTYSARGIYGRSIGTANLGAELRVTYVDGVTDYYEALGKISIEGKIGASKYALTLRGGAPFDSEGEAEVAGWNGGGDFWLRYPLSNNLSVPVLLNGRYVDGAGGAWSNNITAGGGLDYVPAKGLRGAAGLYYEYLYSKANYGQEDTQHRAVLKLSGEKELSDVFVLRTGLDAFYGWAEREGGITWMSVEYLDINGNGTYYRYYYGISPSRDGTDWGINLSVGATWKLKDTISFEPYLRGGYENFNLSGQSWSYYYLTNGNSSRETWTVKGGFSVRF